MGLVRAPQPGGRLGQQCHPLGFSFANDFSLSPLWEKNFFFFFKDSALNALGKGCWELVSWIISPGSESCPQAPQLDGQGGLRRCHPLPLWEVEEMSTSPPTWPPAPTYCFCSRWGAHHDSFNLGPTHFSFRFSFFSTPSWPSAPTGSFCGQLTSALLTPPGEDRVQYVVGE